MASQSEKAKRANARKARRGARQEKRAARLKERERQRSIDVVKMPDGTTRSRS